MLSYTKKFPIKLRIWTFSPQNLFYQFTLSSINFQSDYYFFPLEVIQIFSVKLIQNNVNWVILSLITWVCKGCLLNKEVCSILQQFWPLLSYLQRTYYVIIEVLDVNDNTPQFQGTPYEVTILEVCHYTCLKINLCSVLTFISSASFSVDSSWHNHLSPNHSHWSGCWFKQSNWLWNCTWRWQHSKLTSNMMFIIQMGLCKHAYLLPCSMMVSDISTFQEVTQA